jgi:hypothetical protein
VRRPADALGAAVRLGDHLSKRWAGEVGKLYQVLTIAAPTNHRAAVA